MDNGIHSPPLWSYGLAVMAYLAATLFVHQGQPDLAHRLTGRLLQLAFLASSFWAAASGWILFAPDQPIPRLADTFDTLRYGFWFGFLIVLLYPQPGNRLFGLQATPLAVFGLIIVSVNLALSWVPSLLVSASPQSWLRIAQYAALAQVVFGGVLIEQLFRNTTSDSHWNIKPLGIGLLGMLAYDLYFHSHVLLFNRIDPDIHVVRGYAHTLVLPLIILTIYRTRARQLRVSLSKTATFQTTSLAIAGLYLLAASAAGYYVRYAGGSWGGALQLAVLFSALLLLVLLAFSGTMRARLRLLVGKHFLRYRYDYREEWLKFTNALTGADGSLQIGQLIIRGLADMVESPGGALWMLDSNGQRYIQRARWNLPESAASENKEGVLVTFLSGNNWIINLEEYRHMPARYRDLSLPEWLTELPNAWLIVPLSTAQGIIGFVILGTARIPVDVNWEVNDLLRTAGRQAAAFLAQIQASEALLEARKFESFNRMSAFVVHDLKNIITQLSLMLRNAERHAENPEFQRDMLMTVSHSVDRMKQLMLQLREGTPSPAGTCGVDLAEIARRVQQSKLHQPPAIELSVKQSVSARGHEERIERVIGHLVQNALDATGVNGRVWITIDREDNMALVEVGDTGHGMSAAFVRDDLFRPFKTTKQAGMGIGAYESQQYIRELGGDIHVISTVDVGTRFRIKLPILQSGSGDTPLLH